MALLCSAAAAGCPVQRRRKNRKVVEPKVKVQSAVVDMATGKTPASTAGEAETRVVQVLGIFFFVLLTEGLLLAGSVSGGCSCHLAVQYCSAQLAHSRWGDS
jgi:hypothetical protein